MSLRAELDNALKSFREARGDLDVKIKQLENIINLHFNPIGQQGSFDDPRAGMEFPRATGDLSKIAEEIGRTVPGALAGRLPSKPTNRPPTG